MLFVTDLNSEERLMLPVSGNLLLRLAGVKSFGYDDLSGFGVPSVCSGTELESGA